MIPHGTVLPVRADGTPLMQDAAFAGEPNAWPKLWKHHASQPQATRVTDLAARFQTSLNAVSKHIKTLEAAGLVQRRTIWREHLIELTPAPLAAVDAWFKNLRSTWDLRLDALETHLRECEDDRRDG